MPNAQGVKEEARKQNNQRKLHIIVAHKEKHKQKRPV